MVVSVVCLSRCLSGRFNKQYFAGTLLGMSCCASYVLRTHGLIDDVTRSQSRSNFEIDISSLTSCSTSSKNVCRELKMAVSLKFLKY